MAQKEIIDKIESIIVLLFRVAKDHVSLKVKSGALSSHQGRFFLLERNSLQVLLENSNVRLKQNKEVHIISYIPEVGTLDFATSVIGFGTIRTAQRNIRKLVHVLKLPVKITINDRREEKRYKIPLRENVRAYFDLSKASFDESEDSGEQKSGSGKGSKPSKVSAQLVDVSLGGIRTLAPHDKNRLEQLQTANPPLSAVIELPDQEVKVQLNYLKDKQSSPGHLKHLRFSFYGSNEQSVGKIMDFVVKRAEEEEAKELNRINIMLKRQSRIVDPRTLKSEMREEELDRLKWRRKGDTFIIQTDKLIKGENAFHVFVPKKGEEGVWVMRRR